MPMSVDQFGEMTKESLKKKKNPQEIKEIVKKLAKNGLEC